MARVLILIIGVTIYGFALGGEWIYDDNHSIVANPNIRSIGNIAHFYCNSDAFSANPQWGMYRPILLTTYAINYSFCRYNFTGWQVVNIAIHLLNAMLVYGVVLRFRKDIALWAALLFLAHPLASEPVNYISARSDLLAGTFWLGTMLMGMTGRHLLGVIGLGVGMMTKESLITLPLMIKKRWYFAPAIAFGLWMLWLGNPANAVTDTPRSWLQQFVIQFQVVYESTLLLVAPLWLTIDHVVVPTWWKITIGAWIVTALAWCYYYLEEYRWLILWAVLPLVVTTIIPMNILVSERRLYLSLAPFCVLLAMHLPKHYLVSLGITLSVLTMNRNMDWDSAESLWNSADQMAPRPHLELGMVKVRQAKWEEAEKQFLAAIDLDQEGVIAAKALNNLGALYMQQGRLDEAEGVFNFLVVQAPEEPGVLANMGVMFLKREDYHTAERYLLASLELFPNDPDVWSNLALTYFKLGERDKANNAHSRAVALRQ